ncbi:hypothetical protein V8E55_010924 [Tylopilus felleus]
MAGTTQDPDLDFWDFVTCACCHLPFSPPDRGPPPVPFWITECGHVLCNSHLNPNQSCPKCGAQDIQLVPLQRNIDPPMSDWFRSLPHAIDSMANAVKFQQESLATLVRHYRNQCLQLASTCDRLRNERRALRKDVEALRRELDLCCSRGFAMDQTREPSVHLNHNGKRPMVGIPSQSSSVKTNSSPRSVPTPLGPLRLTLPPGEHPTFSRQEPSGHAYTAEKPGSSRFAEQYAYHEEGNPRARQTQPTDEQQSASLRQPRFINHGTMGPPPTPNQGKRFKPATGQVHSQANQTMEIPSQNLALQRVTKNSDTNMGPPPTPQRPFSAALRTPSRALNQTATLEPSSTLQTSRFIPSSSHSRVFSGLTPATASTALIPASKASGGNRMPFVPQKSSGFG